MTYCMVTCDIEHWGETIYKFTNSTFENDYPCNSFTYKYGTDVDFG